MITYEKEIAEFQRRCDQAGLPGKVVFRLDIHEGMKLRKPVRTAEGYLLVEGKLARPGVLEYVNADGSIRRELITAEELHDPESLGTLGRKPITMLHPDEDVNPDNHADLAVGDISEVVEFEPEAQGGHVIVKIAIKRRDAIEAIENGDLPELSPGYLTRVIEEPGEHPKHGRYDALQTDRRYNHGALVPEARGGHTVALHLDGAAYPVSPPPKPNEDDSVKTILLMLSALALVPRSDMADPEKVKAALIGAEIPEEEAEKIAETIAGIATPEVIEDGDEDDPLKKLQKELDGVKAELDAANEKLAARKGKEHTSDADHDEDDDEDKPKGDQEPTEEEKAEAEAEQKADRLDHFNERVGIFNLALSYELPAEDVKKLDNAELKREVVKAACSNIPDDASDTYIDVRYDMLVKDRKDAGTGVDNPYAALNLDNRRKDGASANTPQVRHDGDATAAADNGLKAAQEQRRAKA